MRPRGQSSASARSPIKRSSRRGLRSTQGRARRDGQVIFANTDPEMVAFFCAMAPSLLRPSTSLDLRIRVYLHEGLDLDAAERSGPRRRGSSGSQFRAPYRAKPDPTIRRNKHENGCVYVGYWLFADASRGHGARTGAANLGRHSGVAQSAEQRPVKPKVEGSSPSPELPENASGSLLHRGCSGVCLFDGHERRGQLGDDGRRSMDCRRSRGWRCVRSTNRCGGSRRCAGHDDEVRFLGEAGARHARSSRARYHGGRRCDRAAGRLPDQAALHGTLDRPQPQALSSPTCACSTTRTTERYRSGNVRGFTQSG